MGKSSRRWLSQCIHVLVCIHTHMRKRAVADSVCCSVLQCVAVCCSVLQVCCKCVAVCCRVLQMFCQCVAERSINVRWPILQCDAVCCSVLCVAVCCSVLQCVAVCCSVLQCVAERTINMRRPIQCSHLSVYTYTHMLHCVALCCRENYKRTVADSEYSCVGEYIHTKKKKVNTYTHIRLL